VQLAVPLFQYDHFLDKRLAIVWAARRLTD
jgi:hypothetical protein